MYIEKAQVVRNLWTMQSAKLSYVASSFINKYVSEPSLNPKSHCSVFAIFVGTCLLSQLFATSSQLFGQDSRVKPRTWTTKDGTRQVVATFVNQTTKGVVLRRQDTNAVITVPFDLLSEADQQYAQQQSAKHRMRPTKPTGAARTWTSKDGKFEVFARLVDSSETVITLVREDDNRELKVPRGSLSKNDLEYLASLQKPNAADTTSPSIGIEMPDAPLIEPGASFPSDSDIPMNLVPYFEAIKNDDVEKVDELDDVIEDMPDPPVELIPALAWALQAPSYEARDLACSCIGKLRHHARPALGDVARFRDNYKAEESYVYAYRALVQLGYMGDYPAVLHDEDDDVRAYAAHALVEADSLDDDVIKSLIELVSDTDPDQSFVRRQAMEPLAAVRPMTDEIVKLLEDALPDDGGLTRLDAIYALGYAAPVSEYARNVLDKAKNEDADSAELVAESIKYGKEFEAKRNARKRGATSSPAIANNNKLQQIPEKTIAQDQPTASESTKLRVKAVTNDVIALLPFCQVDNMGFTDWSVEGKTPPKFAASSANGKEFVFVSVDSVKKTQEAKLAFVKEELKKLIGTLELGSHTQLRATQLDPNLTVRAGIQFEVNGIRPSGEPVFWYVRMKFDDPKQTYIFKSVAPSAARSFELIKISDTFRMLPE